VTPARVGVVPGADSAPVVKRFRSRLGEHLLVVPFTRIFDVPPALARRFDADDREASGLALALGNPVLGETSLDEVVAPAPQSLSLNVSASCNLSCGYCYAARGAFGGAQPSPMAWPTARAAIDRLLEHADPQAPVTVGFLGGEPFANRGLIHESVHYAAAEGVRRGLDVRFSVTTNGTLFEERDIRLLRAHPFAVTVSLDGDAGTQDAQRPLARARDGTSGSFARVVARTRPLLDDPGRAQLAARATITRDNLDVRGKVDAILALGFPEVGVAPLRSPASARGVLRDEDWLPYLEALTAVARAELARALDGGEIRLTNFAVALRQLHRGASAPYPCGAGGGYFSVAADGRWYACHRAIGSADYELGDNTGLDPKRRLAFLEARHVNAQAACRECWARFLCSGGCHQEASSRTESACGFIRGWLEFCLSAYCELADARPDFFAPAQPVASREAQP
jgi:uncharacterized protein